MLAVVSRLENNNTGRDERDHQGCEIVAFSMGDEFPDFSDDNLLESIDFDDLFMGMDDDQDLLPDLEMDLAGEFSLSGGEDSSEFNNNSSVTNFSGDQKVEEFISKKVLEVVSKRDGRSEATTNPTRKQKETGRSKSSFGKSKGSSQGNRKVKVDWTPELHRGFVEAVEQLGIEKAVPSKILEIMGIACLTRHNIASHLQKYRSHRKHVLAREAEAASWSQRRQLYGGTMAVRGGGNSKNGKRHMGPPTMGFPTMTPVHHYRPSLHVWGHPSTERPLLPVWAKHITHSPSPSLSPSPSPTWHPHHQRMQPQYFPQILPQTRFPKPHVPVPGVPQPHGVYKRECVLGVTTPVKGQSCPHPPVDLHPSKESIDAAIGDILSKPWQPLPLGLKPPALDSVMVKLQKQGIQKIPPTCI